MTPRANHSSVGDDPEDGTPTSDGSVADGGSRSVDAPGEPDDRPPNGPLTAVVLAGGDSSRFGPENKALAEFGDSTVLGAVLQTVAARSDREPIVAVRSRAQREELAAAIGSSVRFVFDRPRFDGPIGGLAAAADRADTPWLLVSACDMPLVDPQALAYLEERRGSEVDAVAPTESGQYHPLLTLYRRDAVESVLPDLSDAAGPRAVLDSLERVRRVPVEEAPVEDRLRRSLVSVDTKEDLAAAAPLGDLSR